MMNAHTPFLALVYVSACLLNLVSSNSELCVNSACHPNEPQIRFPFRLRNLQPNQCGYPGFDLTCDASKLTTLQLQNLSFNVQAIDYHSHEIWLNDPNNCLPQRLLTLNLSATPFTGVYYQDFTLFNCSFDYTQHRFNPIACLSGSTYTVVATSSGRAAAILSSSCTLMTTIPVPVQLPYYEQVWSSDLSEDIRLTWNEPQCGKCESRGGRCKLKSNSSYKTECEIQHGLPRGARYAISVAAGLPALLFVAGLVRFIFRGLKARGRRLHPGIEFSTFTTPQPTVISGLDEAAIESFPKTVLGESRRLQNPDDNTCPICLCEYKPHDTLRTIPACQHCFHSNCIGEWLRLNATCPVCRKNQKQSYPPSESAPTSNLDV